MFEPFLENLDGYPIMLPAVSEESSELLCNLRLHNGCIWRWNRPLIGAGGKDKPHLRIEHRVVSSGPTVPDVVANIALFLGIVHFLAASDPSPEKAIYFVYVKKSFYSAARYGLGAQVKWLDGNNHNIQQLLSDIILPEAKKALLAEGLSKEELSYYLDDIIHRRVLTGRNGAAWQKSYISTHGMDFQKMTEKYFKNQERAVPVHEWEV